MAATTVIVALVVAALFWVAGTRRVRVDPALIATVHRGPLTATLTATGTLRSIQAITYRSPVAGRDVEIKELAPEGTHVKEGDLLIKLETTDVEREIERAGQEARQAQMDLEVAQADVQEAEAAVKAVSEGEGVLAVEEARTHLQLAEKKAQRLRQEYAQLKPLMDRGFITREELARTEDELDQAEQELTLARKRTGVAVDLTHPREESRAALQMAQKTAQLGRARTHVDETNTRLGLLRQLKDACTIYALGPGLVVYEENLSANPRRKIRVGDRVSTSQGILTIPEVNRMQIDSTVSEPEMHRVHPGQTADVRVEAFPDLRLTGHVVRVGTLASTSAFRPLDDKRFDLIIELDSAPPELRPEMTMRADITVGQKPDVLLVPVTAVFEREGTFVTYVVTPGGPDRRRVTLGESNAEVSEVVEGLRDHEEVLLTEPAQFGGVADPKSAPPASINGPQPH
jgi:multidrug efflux pump subunit AcrA (membrane-fusion protein)